MAFNTWYHFNIYCIGCSSLNPTVTATHELFCAQSIETISSTVEPCFYIPVIYIFP
jgi:hypothetical protein